MTLAVNGYAAQAPVDTTAYTEGHPHIVRWAWLHGPRSLPPRLLFLRIGLAMLADSEGYIREDQEVLATKLHCGRATLQRNLDDLQAVDQVEREQDPDLDGHHNRYRLTGYRIEGWQPMEDPSDDGSMSLIQIIAQDRARLRHEKDQLQRRVAELESIISGQSAGESPETGHTYKEGRRRGGDTQQEYLSDDTSSSSSPDSKASKRGISYETEIESYLDEHGPCIMAIDERGPGWKSLGAAHYEYANDLAKFERERRMHLKEHEVAEKRSRGPFAGGGGGPRLPEGVELPNEFDVRAGEVWKAVLGDLALQVPRPVYDTWLQGTAAYALTEDVLYVVVPSPFALEWLERRMYPTIVAAARKVLGYSVDVRLQVAEDGSTGDEV